VAGGVADAEEDGLVVLGGALKRFGSPGIPVDRIVLVLKQVGAGFLRESILHLFLVSFRDGYLTWPTM